MKRLFLLILISLSSIQIAFADNLTSSVDRYKLGIDETLKLTITLDDASFSGSPDLSGLDSNFQIINQRSSSSTTIINGDYQSRKEWHYILLPKKSGKLLIPSFKLKNLFSEAIEVDVISNDEVRKQGQQQIDDATLQGDLFLEQKIDKSEVYVQESITLTMQIFTAVQIARPEIPQPSFPGFVVEKLGESEYQSQRNGHTYYVLEYKYALFANKSGKMTIPSQRYQIEQIISNTPRSLFNMPGFNQPNTRTRYLSSPPATLNIKPQPAGVPAPYWLTSEDITINDNWPEQQSLDAGTPLTRTIIIKSMGSLAAQIPPLPTDTIDGLKIYAEQPDLNNTPSGDKFLATRKETIAIVAVQPGAYILPAISIHWWDTKAQQFRISTLPERSLEVKGSPVSAPTQASSITPQRNADNNINSGLVTSAVTDKQPAPFYLNAYLWMACTAFFTALWLTTLIIMIKIKQKTKHDEAYPFEALTKRESISVALKKLQTACNENNAKRARELLIEWARLQWPNEEKHTLQSLKNRINHNEFSVIVDKLDEAIYGGATQWDGKSLFRFMQDNKFVEAKKELNDLPDLYQ